MGYRSEIAIAIDNDLITSEFEQLLHDADLKQKHESYTLYMYDCVKWYESYTEVSEVMSFLNNLDDENFGFIRIGEELGDIELLGTPYDFNLNYSCKIDHS